MAELYNNSDLMRQSIVFFGMYHSIAMPNIRKSQFILSLLGEFSLILIGKIIPAGCWLLKKNALITYVITR